MITIQMAERQGDGQLQVGPDGSGDERRRMCHVRIVKASAHHRQGEAKKGMKKQKPLGRSTDARLARPTVCLHFLFLFLEIMIDYYFNY